MRTKSRGDYSMKKTTISLLTLFSLASCGEQTSPNLLFRTLLSPHLPGAIFTTMPDGSTVNSNIYASKDDVHLDGGPGPNAPVGAAGLPEGDYYFQVTDPSGKDLLSEDHVSCRKVHVNAAGVIDHVYAGTNFVRSQGQWAEVACQHNQGVDLDHAEDGAVTAQLMPYEDTPNNGGVYKVWMTRVEDYVGEEVTLADLTKPKDDVTGEGWAPNDFHGFVPAFSKTDNYKVKYSGKPCDPSLLTLTKFHDANANGVQDDDEETVTGWLMTVADPTLATNEYFTTAEVMVNEGTWGVAEDVPATCTPTVSVVDGVVESVWPTASPQVLVDVGPECGEGHDVLFGNVGLGSVTVCKVYDRDADGERDDGEPLVPGWSFTLVGTDLEGAVGPLDLVTNADGCVTVDGLLPGTYTVTEHIPEGTAWTATGDLSQEVVVESSLDGSKIAGTQVHADFTNICEGTADFGTKGYWHNKNGLAEVTDSDVAYVNSLSPYSSPSTYFESGDEPFDGLFEDGTSVAASKGITGELLAPEGSTLAEVSQFLVEENGGGDHREQLAQQLLAFIFNAIHRTGGVGSAVKLPDGTWTTTQALVDEAVALWESGSDEERVAHKDLLDWFNNGSAVEYVAHDPC